MRKLIFLLAILCLVGLTSASFADNLLDNAGFEGPSISPWMPTCAQFGNPAQGGLTTEEYRSGAQSCKGTGTVESPFTLDGPSGNTCSMKQQVAVDQSGATVYRLSAWVKAPANLRAVIAWDLLDNTGALLGSGIGDWSVGTGDWMQITNGPDAILFPAAARWVMIYVRIAPTDADGVGTAYLDDCAFESELVPTPEDPTIFNQGFETQDGNAPPAPWVAFSYLPGGTATYTNESTEVRTGSYSCGITNPGFGVGISQDITAATAGFDTTGATQYLFKAYVKKTVDALYPLIMWYAYDAVGTQLTGGSSGPADNGPAGGWVQINSGDFAALPPQTVSIKLIIMNALPGTGTVYVDDFFVVSQPVPTIPNLLKNPGFEIGDVGAVPPTAVPFWTYLDFGSLNPMAVEDGTVNPDRVRNGNQSFSITTTGLEIEDGNGPYQDVTGIDSSGFTDYRYSAWVKKTGPSASIPVAVRWKMLTAGDVSLAEGYVWDESGATGTDWVQITTDAIHPPSPDVAKLRLAVYLRDNDQGEINTVYIDDCAITSEPAPVGYLQGQVTDPLGNPVPGAVVGIKTSAFATADSGMYITTNEDGNYGPIPILPGTVYVAAWQEGFAPTEDTEQIVTLDNTFDVNIQFASLAGKNLSVSEPGRSTMAIASKESEPANAADGDLGSRWSIEPSSGPEWWAVDLDTTYGTLQSVSGVTIYSDWGHFGDYAVEYTVGDPLDIYAVWTPAGYSTTTGNGGYNTGNDPTITVNPIRFDAPVSVRGIRVNGTCPHNGITVWEIKVHSATELVTMVGGTVYYPDGVTPAPGAVVGIKNSPYATSDSPLYLVTDENGNYGPIPADAGMYVAAWLEGYAVTADETVPTGGGYQTVDLTLPSLAGKNLSVSEPGRSTMAIASKESEPTNAADGDLGSRWSIEPSSGPEWWAVDLDTTTGTPQSVSGVTIYSDWGHFGDYAVEYTVGDPLDIYAVWTPTGYSTTTGNGGYNTGNDPTITVNPILFTTPVSARGIRVNGTGSHGGITVWEIKVHSATELLTMVSGTVYYPDGTTPAPDALVGIKNSAGATADAPIYAVTDENGNYGPIPANAGMYVAAWKEGWTPTADETVPTGGGSVTVDLTIPQTAGKNLSLAEDGRSVNVWATSMENDDPNYAGAKAADDDPNSRWSSSQSTTGDESVYLDLDTSGAAHSISGVTLYWEWSYPSAYSVEYTTEDPTTTTNWTEAYSSSNAGGADYHTMNWGGRTDPILFTDEFGTPTPVTARAVRVHCTAKGPGNGYSAWEFQVHSATEFLIAVSGTVTDVDDNPVAGALVGIKSGVNATADASTYAVTDENGNYGPVPANAGMYVAAWAEGWTPTEDETVPTGGGMVTVDLQLTTPASTNLSLTAASIWSESTENDDPEMVAAKAADDSLDTRWSSGQNQIDDQSWFADLGGTYSIDAVTIYWEWSRAWAYKLEYTTDDPASPTATWLDAGFEQYEATGGYDDGNNHFIDPIRLPAPVVARGFRVHGIYRYGNGYSAWEIQVHGEEASVVVPVELSDIRTTEDGTLVAVTGVELTAIPSVGGVPAGVAYVETADRSCGIRLDTTAVTLAEVIGDVIDFQGVVGTTLEGEKYVALDSVGYVSHSDPTIAALGMNNRFANDGLTRALFVKVWGNVVESGTDYFVISDGSVDSSGTPITIRVSCASGTAPTSGLVAVSGVLSTDGTSAILYKTD